MTKLASLEQPLLVRAQLVALHEFHLANGASMANFEGCEIPNQYHNGTVAEHHHCRTKASFFDVSYYVQQLLLVGHDIPQKLEKLTPSAIQELKQGKARYTVLTNDQGGIREDMILSHADDYYYVVLNGAMSDHNIAYLRAHLGDIEIIELNDQALFDIQGPLSEKIVSKLIPVAPQLKFMGTQEANILGAACRISRLGFTGEDGFQLSVPMSHALDIADALLSDDDLQLAGFGARESLRIDAGFNQYGYDIDAITSPVEAQLQWLIQKRRIEGADFPGAKRIVNELKHGPTRKLVGLMPEGFKPPQIGKHIYSSEGEKIGRITSSTFSPTIGAPIAVGYVTTPYAEIGTEVILSLEDGPVNARISKRPFVPHRYKR